MLRAVPARPSVGLLVVSALAASAALVPAKTQADVGGRLGRLTQLRDEVLRTKGPAAYVPLRRLWLEWDQGDPAEVETVLHGLTEERALHPAHRAYAGLLEAYARRRRGDVEGAQSRVARLGFVGRWMVVGPFDNEGKGGFSRAFGPEEDVGQPITVATLGKAYEGKEHPVKWRLAPASSPFGWFDLGVYLRPADHGCGYVATFVRDGSKAPAARPISLWAGSAGAMKVFWNGREVLRDERYRDLDADRFATTVPLDKGWNRLVVKVCGDEGDPMVSLRLAAVDGSPDPRIETDPDPAHGEGLASTPPAGGKATKAPATAGGVQGAIQAFESAVAGAGGRNATLLEAYARYLVLTQGDDPAVRVARDLARRAADAQPTVGRLLLAGQLAEDRNQRGAWLEKAQRRATPPNAPPPEDEALALLLARGAHAHAGPNGRDAAPFYARALAADPDDTAAVLAQVELYDEAGLHETGLTFLERAVARRPRSVALLRAMAAALRAGNRTTEADEVDERWAQLRFDDPSFLRGRVDFALAHRDKDSAFRWIDRLLAVSPGSASSLAAAARAYVALGERPRAIAAYRRALDLAPEDVETMRSLSDVYAVAGQTDEQLKLLRRILELRPQDKDVRDYVAHTEPQKARADEVYARPAAEFLKRRGDPARGQARRTLSSLQVTTVFPNGLASRFHQVVFQPLTEAAAAEARTYSFAFEADTEAVQLRGARVYRVDGRIDEAVETGEGNVDNPSLAMYSSSRAFYVSFPRLGPGDVVELQYRVEDVTPRNAFADYFGEVVYLQNQEPVFRTEYVLFTPKSRTFYFNKPVVPGLSSTVEEQGPSRIYRFTAADVPALEPEARQPPFAELLGHVHVSTYKTWDDMARWYWGLVRDQFTPDAEVKRRVAELTKGLKTNEEKVRAVYGYVVQRTRYVALEFGIHGFKPYRCAQIFARGFGDCKDKATLIVTMLKELGIPATIVIVRTQHRGDFETEPASLAPFDHAIAYVPSMDLYLDGTAEFTGSRELPSMDRGALALQINEGAPKLVHMPDPPPEESVASRRIEAQITETGSAQVEWRVEVTGSQAGTFRQRYHAEATRKTRMQEDLGKEQPGFELTSSEALTNLEDVEQKVGLRAKGKVPAFGRRDGDSITLPAGPREYLVREYASLSQRRRDVQLGARSTAENEYVLHVPPGLRVISAPKAAEGQSPFGRYKVEVETTGTVVRVKTTVVLGKTRIAAAEYGAFRAFCENVDRSLGQRLVLGRGAGP